MSDLTRGKGRRENSKLLKQQAQSVQGKSSKRYAEVDEEPNIVEKGAPQVQNQFSLSKSQSLASDILRETASTLNRHNHTQSQFFKDEKQDDGTPTRKAKGKQQHEFFDSFEKFIENVDNEKRMIDSGQSQHQTQSRTKDNFFRTKNNFMLEQINEDAQGEKENEYDQIGDVRLDDVQIIEGSSNNEANNEMPQEQQQDKVRQNQSSEGAQMQLKEIRLYEPQQVRPNKILLNEGNMLLSLKQNVEDSSSLESNKREYQDISILDFGDIWQKAQQEVGMPYIQKQKKQVKSCCPLFRPKEKLSTELEFEKQIVKKLRLVNFNVESKYHRDLLYTIQQLMPQSEKTSAFEWPSRKWLRVGFKNTLPDQDIKQFGNGIFGLIQILALLYHYQEMVSMFASWQDKYPDIRFCSLLLQISAVIGELLINDRLDNLILRYKSTMNSVNQLFAAAVYEIMFSCKGENNFDESLINRKLTGLSSKSDERIMNLALNFSKNLTNYTKHF